MKTALKINKEKKNKGIKEKIIQILTVVPQLVTLNCSLTHVLQAPNTHPNTVKSWMDKGYM